MFDALRIDTAVHTVHAAVAVAVAQSRSYLKMTLCDSSYLIRE